MGNVCFHLLYDLNSHHLNLFTSCRFEAIMFGDANGDDRLDFLDFDNSGMCTTVPTSSAFTIQLYSDNGKGNFVLQKDRTRKPYFIDGDRGSDRVSHCRYHWFGVAVPTRECLSRVVDLDIRRWHQRTPTRFDCDVRFGHAAVRSMRGH